MFGQNHRMKEDLGDGYSLLVREIFPTIQGEGPFSGIPSVFIRLGGCHLACSFCDTDFDADKSSRMHIQEIVHAIDEVRSKLLLGRLVVITGGEPMRQNIGPLVLLLQNAGSHVQIETSGSFWPFDSATSQGLVFTSDPSTPGVSCVVSPKTGYVHPTVDQLAVAWKYVVRIKDAERAMASGLDFMSDANGPPVHLARPTKPPPLGEYLQPCDEIGGKLDHRLVQRVSMLCMKFGYRLSLQCHKITKIDDAFRQS